ncbi:MAG: sce7726 family protein [Bacteroidota bacterium]
MKDPCIRQLLRDTELAVFLNDEHSKVVEELNLPVAKARIDMAVINGSLHGFEIKSASDTLKRLPSQIEAYSKVFDYLSIVTEGKYYDKILLTIPEWVGVIVCSDDKGILAVNKIRQPKFNIYKECFYVAKLLWRDELIQILTERNIKFRKKDRNWILCEILASELDIETLSKIVRSKLKERDNWKLA